MLTQNLSEFWERLYSEGNDNWDLGKTTPMLEEFFKSPQYPGTGRILVPGAGRGYDALAWAEKGHETVAVDFCPTAVDALENLSRNCKKLTAVDQDIFELSPDDVGQFDYIYEYCCFSAIHPGRRDEYFEIWTKMLKDDGRVLAFFYPLTNGNTMQGPPHCTTEGELMARLDGLFEVEATFPIKGSLPEREGEEELWVLKKVME